MNAVFLDTGYVIALEASDDQSHTSVTQQSGLKAAYATPYVRAQCACRN